MIRASARSELVTYAIRDIVLEAKALEKQGNHMLYLNIGDPAPFGFRPPQHILDAAAEALRENYSGYAPSHGDPELRQTVAEYEGVAKENVFITTGLSEGIHFLFDALVDPGRSIALPIPSYPMYITKQRVNFGPLEFYCCDENYEPDLDSLRKSITKYTKAILVNNPNNPTGAVYSRKTLEGIVNIAGEHGLPIISDDAYEHIVMDDGYVNLRKLHKDVPLVSGNSMSKNYIYPGARVGYLAFHGGEWDEVKNAIGRICNLRLSTTWEMQRACIAAIKGPQDHVMQFNSDLKKRREVLMKRVNELDELRAVAPRGAFYAFLKVESDRWKNDWTFVRELLKHGVVVVPGSGFGQKDGVYFRMVILPSPEDIDEAFNRIGGMLSKNKAVATA